MIYKLFVKANRDCTIYPEDLEYFQGHFVCKRMDEPWVPPPFKIVRKSKPVRDFVGWDLSAPVLSDRALSILRPLLEDYCQVLPFVEIKKVQLYCLNVLVCFDSLVDVSKPHLPIFKILEFDGCVYVNEQFVQSVIENKLYGAGFTTDLKEPSYVFDSQIDNLEHWIHTSEE